jgi:hypothetical protein
MSNNNNNQKFKEQLNSFYDYLDRNGKYNKNDDTQSCINMKLNRTVSSSTTTTDTGSINRGYSKNMLKLLNQAQNRHQQNQQQQQQQINNNDNTKTEDFYNCLFTPRLSNRKQNFSINEKTNTNSNSSSYLTWKSFNCNPIPNLTKETAIINDMPNIENNEIRAINKSSKPFRYNLSNQNLGVIYDENDYESINNKENFGNLQGKAISMSTPGTPLLSSCTLPRYNLFLCVFFFTQSLRFCFKQT